MGLYIGGSRINREDPPGAPGRQQKFEGIGYGDIYHRAQGNTGIGCTGTQGYTGPTGCTGVLGSKGPTGCIGPRGIPGWHEGYNTTGLSYGYPTTGTGGLSVGVTGEHHSEEGNMSAKKSNRISLMSKWYSDGKIFPKMEEDTEFVELELPPEAYETQTQQWRNLSRLSVRLLNLYPVL